MKDSATLTSDAAGEKSRNPSLTTRSAAAGIAGTFRS